LWRLGKSLSKMKMAAGGKNIPVKTNNGEKKKGFKLVLCAPMGQGEIKNNSNWGQEKRGVERWRRENKTR